MKTVGDRIGGLQSQINALKDRKEKASLDREREMSKLDTSIVEVQRALDDTRWQEALETVDRELTPMYVEACRNQAQIPSCIDSWIASVRKGAAKIRAMQDDVAKLSASTKATESQLLDSRPDERDLLAKAIAERKAQATQEHQAPEPDQDALGILESVLPDAKSRSGPWTPARKIYEELQRAGGKLRIREGDLLRVAGINETRIIAARDRMEEHLTKMQEGGLLDYTNEGDMYLIVEEGKA